MQRKSRKIPTFVPFQTVGKLAPSAKLFSRESLFSEFKSRLLYGFLEGICLYSTVYESQLKRVEEAGKGGDDSGLSDGDIDGGEGVRPR